MPLNRMRIHFLRLIVVSLAVTGLFASENHGLVKSGGLPVPGATVTASMADKKEVTTTDDQGAYTFPDLADGVWSIKVEILGFQTATRDIGVAFDAPPAEWDLKLMTAADLADALKPKEAPAPAVASAPTPAAPTAAGAPAAATAATAATTAATPAPAAAASTTPAATQQASNANGGRGGTNQAGRGARNSTTAATGRGGTQSNTAAGRGGTQANGRPSLLAAGGFQEVGVSQSAETSTFSQEGNISADATAELSQSANQAYVIQGSQSTAMGMGGQADFGGGFGGPGGPGGFGGPGGMGGDATGMGGIPGMGGDAAGGAAAMGGGRGGAGGAGGGPGMGGGRGGAGGGPGGGGGGFGGPGGGGFGGGRGGGGMGFAGGGRGGPGGRGMNQAGARAFGNNRRNPRMMYTGSLNINEANSLLNAQSYSLTGINLGKPYSNRTNVTGSVGGPFKIPKLLDGTKGQFQLNFTVSRSRSGGQSALTTMPNALERQGDFQGVLVPTAANPTGAPVVVYDPTTCTASGCIPYPNNTVPVSALATQLLKFYAYPNVNLTAFKNNYQVPTTPLANTNSINSRVNQTLNAKNRMMVSFAYQGNNGSTPNQYAFLDPNTGTPIVDTNTGRSMNASGTWSHNFSTRLINSVVYTFSRSRTLQSPYFSGLTNIEGNLGIQGVATDPLNWGPPSLSFTNFGGLSDRTASLVRNQTSSLTESLMWVHGKHTFTFGGGYRRQQFNTQNNSNPRGSFSFNGDATSNFINGVPVAGTGFDLADFLIGVPDTARVQCSGGGATNLCNGDPSYYFRGAVTSAYVTDDWRIHPRFSVSLGARWDYQTPVYELNNQIVNMAFAPNFTAYAPVVPGGSNPFTGQPFPSALVKSDPRNVSPRFGFAWRPSAKKSTVVRGGYGVSYNTSAYSSMAMQLAQQPPQARSLNLSILNDLPLLQTGGITMQNALNLAASAGSNLSKNTYAIDPNYKIGYAQTWNVSIQQNLPFSFQTTATYTGVKGTNLDREIQPWTLPPGSTLPSFLTAAVPAACSALPAALQANCAAAPGYTYETYGANSSANLGSIQMMRRFSGGVSVNTSYTFTKYLAEPSGTPVMNWQNARLDRYAQTGPHRVNISAQYSTGQGRMGAGLLTGWKGHLIKDWTIQTTISMASGNPLTPSCSGNVCLAVGSTGLSSRPEYTGAPIAPTAVGDYFNTAAFIAPLPGVWGSAARGSIPGPFAYSLNASASRVFRFGERRSMDLQLQSTNVLNTVILNGYNTSVGNLTYGQATGTSGMRTVTASLRFRF